MVDDRPPQQREEDDHAIQRAHHHEHRRPAASCMEQVQADWQKPPLQPKHVWAIRTRLQLSKRRRDLALFNLAIDSKLRGCDVVSLKVADVAPHGYAIDRAAARQRKTGRPVRFELTEQTRQSIDDYLALVRKRPNELLFGGRRGSEDCLTTRQYARLVSSWIGSIGLEPSLFGTHSLRPICGLPCATLPRAGPGWHLA